MHLLLERPCGFTASETMGWLRIVRLRSVIAQQQRFLCRHYLGRRHSRRDSAAWVRVGLVEVTAVWDMWPVTWCVSCGQRGPGYLNLLAPLSGDCIIGMATVSRLPRDVARWSLRPSPSAPLCRSPHGPKYRKADADPVPYRCFLMGNMQYGVMSPGPTPSLREDIPRGELIPVTAEKEKKINFNTDIWTE